MKIVAFGASTSSKSINKQLAQYAGELATEIKTGIDLEVLDLNDYEIPLFSQDKEAELGQPEAARAFFDKLGASDAIIISFAEHNGSYSAAYKNLFDWTSRINQKLFQNKPMILLSTSPGPGGAANAVSYTHLRAHETGRNCINRGHWLSTLLCRRCKSIVIGT